MVKQTGGRGELPFSDADCHVVVVPDVLNPTRGFTHFCEQVETLSVDHKPNLNLSRQPRPTPNRGQIKDLLVRNTLGIHRRH
jgi:hypothetical protein